MFFLLLAVAGLPLLGLALTVGEYVDTHYQMLQEDLWRDVAAKLAAMDEGFLGFLGTMEQDLQNLFAEPLPPGPAARQEAIRRILQVRRRYNLQGGYLIDRQGRVVDMPGVTAKAKRHLKMMRPLYACIMDELCGNKAQLGTLQQGRLSKLAGLSGLDIRVMYADIMRSVRRLKRYRYQDQMLVRGAFPMSPPETHSRSRFERLRSGGPPETLSRARFQCVRGGGPLETLRASSAQARMEVAYELGQTIFPPFMLSLLRRSKYVPAWSGVWQRNPQQPLVEDVFSEAVREPEIPCKGVGEGAIARRTPQFLAVFGWMNRFVTHAYVDRFVGSDRDIGVAALYRRHQRTVKSAGVPAGDWLAQVGQRLRVTGAPVRTRLQVGNTRFCVVGRPGSELNFYDLVGVASLQPLEDAMARIWRGIFLIGLLAVALGGVAAHLLTEYLLAPMKQMMFGATSIRQGRFQVRLPVLHRDELGAMTQAFNHMAEGLGDLEVARILHETLLPTSSLTSGGLEIWGKSTAGSITGGEYYDYFVLPSGKVFAMIGQISGPPLAAGMALAMVKSLVMWYVERAEDLSGLAALIHRVLRDTFQGKHQMKAVIMKIDPHPGDYQSMTAGSMTCRTVSPTREMKPLPCAEGPALGGDSAGGFSVLAGSLAPQAMIVLETQEMLPSLERKSADQGTLDLLCGPFGEIEERLDRTVPTDGMDRAAAILVARYQEGKAVL